MTQCLNGRSISQCFLMWFPYKIFLVSNYAAPIYFIFIFRRELNMKSFSHANNIVLRRVIYIYSWPGVKLVKLFSLANETWCAVTVPPFDFVKGDCAVENAILDKKGYKLNTEYNIQNLWSEIYKGHLWSWREVSLNDKYDRICNEIQLHLIFLVYH